MAGTGGRTRLKLRARQLAAAIAGIAALITAFELGELRADRQLAQAETVPRLGRELAALKAENRAAREQLARQKTEEKINREAYSQVERKLADLQGKILEQQEELAFYRGIVGSPDKGGVQVRNFALIPAATGARLRFVLAQDEGVGRKVQGKLQIRVEGTRAGRVVSLDLASLAANPSAVPMSFGFRYFQDIDAELHTPPNFTPQRIVIRILPATSGVKASVESFPWSLRAG